MKTQFVLLSVLLFSAFMVMIPNDDAYAQTPPPSIPIITTSPTTVSDNSFTIEGTAEADSIITLTQNGIELTDTATAVNGDWSIDVTLINGPNIFTATASDTATPPNVSVPSSPPVTITLDTTSSNAPPVLDNIPDMRAYLGILLTFNATASDPDGDNLTFTLESTSGSHSATISDTGEFEFTPSIDVDLTLDVIVSDGTDTDSQTFNIDFTSADDRTDAPIITTSPTTVSDNSFTITGTAVPDSIITLTQNGIELTDTATASPDAGEGAPPGTWSIDVTLSDGENIFTATASDGLTPPNVSAPSSPPVTITLETTTPSITLTSAVYNGITGEIIFDFDENVESINPDGVIGLGVIGFTIDSFTLNSDASISDDNLVLDISNSGSFISLDPTIRTNSLVVNFPAGIITGTGINVNSEVVNFPITLLDVVVPPTITVDPTPTINTDTNTVSLSGTRGSAGNNIELFRDDVLVPFDGSEAGGPNDSEWLNPSVPLITGNNVFTAIAINALGTRSAPSEPYTISNYVSSLDNASVSVNDINTSSLFNDERIITNGFSNPVFSLTTVDGSPVPDWLTIDGSTAVSSTVLYTSPCLLDTPDIPVQSFTFRLTATQDDTSEFHDFDVTIRNTPLLSDLCDTVKSGGSSNDWKKKPTFGKSWEISSAQLVQDGFTFNGYTLDITDNWHTPFRLTNATIGDSNNVHIKTYATNGLKYVTLSLGVPEIGDVSDAETDIIVYFERNYDLPATYQISEIIHEQDELLVNPDNTSAVITKEKCNPSDKENSCYGIDINFTIDAPLSHNVLAIGAVDEKRRSNITYINDGVEFTGESLLEPATHKIIQKKSNQISAESIILTQQDRRYQVWEDQHGYLWTQNSFGTWTQMTNPEFVRHNDEHKQVMTRLHSSFNDLVLGEREKATIHFDSQSIQSLPDESFAYDYPISSEKLSDPEILKTLDAEEILALEKLHNMFIYEDDW